MEKILIRYSNAVMIVVIEQIIECEKSRKNVESVIRICYNKNVRKQDFILLKLGNVKVLYFVGDILWMNMK